jgi:MYXO-CTERM domain-containing protein
MKLNKILAAVAILAAGAANASIDLMSGATSITPGNSSLILVKEDSTGINKAGLTVDLGYNLSDFVGSGALTAANTTVVWDFAANTITTNGALVSDSTTNNWSAFSAFAGDASESFWSVMAGSVAGTSARQFLVAGTPDAAQLTQTTPTVISALAKANAQYLLPSQNLGTLGSAVNGSYAMTDIDAGWVGTGYGLTDTTGFQKGTKWSTWNTEGGSTNLWNVINNGTKKVVADSSLYSFDAATQALDTTGLTNGAGTFTLAGTTLTWKTASITTLPVTNPVPEPETFALALVGLAALAVARRRAAK